MRVLFQLGHPAHFHLFKNTIANLQRDGHQTYILIKKKDILEELLKSSGMSYVNILPGGKRSPFALLLRLWRIFRFSIYHRINILVGSTPEVAIVGWLLHRRSVITVEDDYSVIPQFDNAARPFADTVLSPVSCDNGPLEKRTTHYAGFQKLAYLHPNQFSPDPAVVDRYFPHDQTFFLLRFANLKAYHDVSICAQGITDELATKLISKLLPHGRVFITSERPLPLSLESYKLEINPLDIHHILAFATLYIGDSQSMAVEAAMLGTPSIRFSAFAGRIGVLEELEQNYHLTIGIPSDNPDQLIETIDNLLSTDNLRNKYQTRRQQMLTDKIDVTQFYTDFIEKLQ